MKLRALLILGAASIVASSNAALTGNLYLAQGNNSGGSNFVDQVFSDFPDFSTVSGNVVTVGASGWNVSNIQAEFLDFGSFISGGVNTALLTVSKFNTSPSTDHTASVSAGADIIFSGNVAASITNVSGSQFNFEVDTTAISQLQGLGGGSYIVTLSPVADFGTFGQAFHNLSTDTSADGWTINPGGGFGLPIGTGWGTYVAASGDTGGERQFSLGINGTNAVPEPASLAVLGLGAAFMIRRRRK